MLMSDNVIIRDWVGKCLPWAHVHQAHGTEGCWKTYGEVRKGTGIHGDPVLQWWHSTSGQCRLSYPSAFPTP